MRKKCWLWCEERMLFEGRDNIWPVNLGDICSAISSTTGLHSPTHYSSARCTLAAYLDKIDCYWGFFLRLFISLDRFILFVIRSHCARSSGGQWFIQMIYTKSGFCPRCRQQNAKVAENAESGSSLASYKIHICLQHMSLEKLITPEVFLQCSYRHYNERVTSYCLKNFEWQISPIFRLEGRELLPGQKNYLYTIE